jgi:hypothetical protein
MYPGENKPMPLTLSDLTAEKKKLPIAISDDPEAITVWYRPHNMTATIEKKAREAAEKGAELEAIVEMILPVVAEWDFRMTADADIVPCTREGFSEVPTSILLLILEAVGADRNPDPKAT